MQRRAHVKDTSCCCGKGTTVLGQTTDTHQANETRKDIGGTNKTGLKIAHAIIITWKVSGEQSPSKKKEMCSENKLR